MPTEDDLPEPPPFGAWPRPRTWTRDEFYRLADLGVFDRPFGRRRVERIDGELWEQHHEDKARPAPRPFPFTRNQFRTIAEAGLFDGQRVELLGGSIYLRSPAHEPHVTGVALMADALRAAFGAKFYVRVHAPLAIGSADEIVPDLAVVPGGPRDYQNTPKTALIVVEVSDTTTVHDTTTKAACYAAAGIADYWVMDLPNARLLVLRDPGPGSGGHAYRTHVPLGPADDVFPLAVPTAAIRVADILP